MAPTTRRLIYQMMIVPLINVQFDCKHRKNKWSNEKCWGLTRRSSAIIDDGKPVKSIQSEILFQCCKFVRKCLNGTVCKNLKNYFVITNHTANIRNNKISVELPKLKLSCAKKAFLAGPRHITTHQKNKRY